MTSIVDRYAIKNKELDKRYKLTDKDREEITALYPSLSLRDLAHLYDVDKRTIQFVLYPERLKTVNFKGHWKKYYNKEKHRIAIAKYRQHKKELLEKGLL